MNDKKSIWVGWTLQVRALIVSKRVTREGEVLPVYERELVLGDSQEEGDHEGRLFLVWPVIVQHCITESSPLWDVSADDLSSGHKHFEIIIILEGIVESTGMTAQASANRPDNRSWVKWVSKFRWVTGQGWVVGQMGHQSYGHQNSDGSLVKTCDQLSQWVTNHMGHQIQMGHWSGLTTCWVNESWGKWVTTFRWVTGQGLRPIESMSHGPNGSRVIWSPNSDGSRVKAYDPSSQRVMG